MLSSSPASPSTGWLVPVVAVRTSDGELRVRYGHRRTLAAAQAGLSAIAVIVAADEAHSDEATVERLVEQYAENEHRTGLSNAERVDVFAQMAAFGVSPTKIAKRTKTKKTEVDAALTVAKSEMAKVATARHDWLTLNDAAVLAEFFLMWTRSSSSSPPPRPAGSRTPRNACATTARNTRPVSSSSPRCGTPG